MTDEWFNEMQTHPKRHFQEGWWKLCWSWTRKSWMTEPLASSRCEENGAPVLCGALHGFDLAVPGALTMDYIPRCFLTSGPKLIASQLGFPSITLLTWRGPP